MCAVSACDKQSDLSEGVCPEDGLWCLHPTNVILRLRETQSITHNSLRCHGQCSPVVRAIYGEGGISIGRRIKHSQSLGNYEKNRKNQKRSEFPLLFNFAALVSFDQSIL